MYPPLSLTGSHGGLSVDSFIIALHLVGLSSLSGAINVLSTVGYAKRATFSLQSNSLYTWSLVFWDFIVYKIPLLRPASPFWASRLEHDVDPGDPFWVTGIGVKLKRRKPASPKWASRSQKGAFIFYKSQKTKTHTLPVHHLEGYRVARSSYVPQNIPLCLHSDTYYH